MFIFQTFKYPKSKLKNQSSLPCSRTQYSIRCESLTGGSANNEKQAGFFPSVLPFESLVRNTNCKQRGNGGGKGIPALSACFSPKAWNLQAQRNAYSLLLLCQSVILQDWTLSHHETTCESQRLYRNRAQDVKETEALFLSHNFPGLFQHVTRYLVPAITLSHR